MGDGSTRRIRLTVLAFLVLSGMALQGLVWWYGVQTTTEKWDVAAVQVWPFAIGIWILTVGLTLALLRKRLKYMQKERTSECKTGPTLHNLTSANQRPDVEFRSGCFTTKRSCYGNAFPAQQRRRSGLSQPPTRDRRPDGFHHRFRAPRSCLECAAAHAIECLGLGIDDFPGDRCGVSLTTLDSWLKAAISHQHWTIPRAVPAMVSQWSHLTVRRRPK